MDAVQKINSSNSAPSSKIIKEEYTKYSDVHEIYF
jgi:hypothetical protein